MLTHSKLIICICYSFFFFLHYHKYLFIFSSLNLLMGLVANGTSCQFHIFRVKRVTNVADGLIRSAHFITGHEQAQ